MNVLIIPMPSAMARDVAKAADMLKMPSNDAFGFAAVNLLLQSVQGKRRGRPYKFNPPKPPAKARRSTRGRRPR